MFLDEIAGALGTFARVMGDLLLLRWVHGPGRGPHPLSSVRSERRHWLKWSLITAALLAVALSAVVLLLPA